MSSPTDKTSTGNTSPAAKVNSLSNGLVVVCLTVVCGMLAAPRVFEAFGSGFSKPKVDFGVHVKINVD